MKKLAAIVLSTFILSATMSAPAHAFLGSCKLFGKMCDVGFLGGASEDNGGKYGYGGMNLFQLMDTTFEKWLNS